MARIDDLIAQVADKQLRQRLESAMADMKRRQRFGLVFEEHIPETTTLYGFPIQVGTTVQRRSDVAGKTLFRVTQVLAGGKITMEPEDDGPEEREFAKNLLVVKRFGDPIFPALTSIGTVRRGSAESRATP